VYATLKELKIKYKHSSILWESIDIAVIENSPAASKSIEDKETGNSGQSDKHSFLYIKIII